MANTEINPYDAPWHGQERAKRSHANWLATLCAIASPICLVMTWTGMYLLVSVGLYQGMGNPGHFYYRLTGVITSAVCIAGICATFTSLVLGSRFERVAMVIMLVPYSP